MNVDITPNTEPGDLSSSALKSSATPTSGERSIFSGTVSPQILELALANANDVILIVSAETSEQEPLVVYVNASFERQTGFTAAEAAGQVITFQCTPQSVPEIQAKLRQAIAERVRVVIEAQQVRRNGTQYMSEWDMSPICDPQGRLFYVVLQHDTTDRRRVENELRRERDINSTMIQSSPTLFGAISPDGKLIMANPAILNLLGYTREEIMGKWALWSRYVPRREQRAVANFLGELLKSQVPMGFENHLISKDGTEILIGWRGTPIRTASGDLDYIFLIGANISEKRRIEEAKKQAEDMLVQSNILLEQRVLERTRELSKILDVSQTIGSTLQLDKLLRVILEELRDVLHYSSSSILTIDNATDLVLSSYVGPIAEADRVTCWKLYSEVQGHMHDVLVHRKPVVIGDVNDGSPLAQLFRQRTMTLGSHSPERANAWMGVPLVVRDHLIGVLVLESDQRDAYNEHSAQLAMTFANQAVMAIENARLFDLEQERRAESERRRFVAEGLGNILDILNSSSSLNDTLSFILGQAMQLLDAPNASVWQLNPKHGVFTLQAAREGLERFVGQVAVPSDSGPLSRAISNRRPDSAANMAEVVEHARGLLRTEQAAWQECIDEHRFNVMIVPIFIKDNPYGVFTLFYQSDHVFSREEQDLAMTLADQAALAIENDQLRVKSVQAAALAERNRLARELHDSVSQALFGISLGTRTSLELLGINPARAREPLEFALSLTEAALAEMRALIFELRSESLETEGLHVAFTKQAAMLVARHKIDVKTNLKGDESDLPLDLKEALYRIGLEAIQNTIKHAKATHIELSLSRPEPDQIIMEVRDDGAGFDTAKSFPGHFGLTTMRERAELFKGTIEFESVVGKGTCVRVQMAIPTIAAARQFSVAVD